MPAAERRELILGAARDEFGKRGYYGATTDQIAKAAGISQPYVVRMFGTKEKLFLEVIHDALDTLMVAFREAHADALARGATGKDLQMSVGGAFIDLVTTKGLHTVLLQAFVSGSDPAIGAAAREGFLEIYRFLRDEVHFPLDAVEGFLGSGMLFSVLLGIQMPSVYSTDSDAAELMEASFGEKCRVILDTMVENTD